MNWCEQILIYAQGELPLDQQQAMREHVKTCAACQKELAFLTRINQALVPPAAPAGLVDKVFAKTTRKKSWFGAWKKALAGAAAMGVALVLFVDLHHAPKTAFDAREIVAYMNADLVEDYQLFDADLSAWEEDFNIGG